jgi:hypothetical protein
MSENKANSFKVNWYIVKQRFGKRTKGFKKYLRKNRNEGCGCRSEGNTPFDGEAERETKSRFYMLKGSLHDVDAMCAGMRITAAEGDHGVSQFESDKAVAWQMHRGCRTHN